MSPCECNFFAIWVSNQKFCCPKSFESNKQHVQNLSSNLEIRHICAKHDIIYKCGKHALCSAKSYIPKGVKVN